MKKKILGLLLSMSLVTTMLTGCGSSKSTAKNGELNLFVSTTSGGHRNDLYHV